MAQGLREFVGYRIPRPPVAMSAAIAGLDEEIGDDAMEFHPIVKWRTGDKITGPGIDEGF